MSSSNLPPVRHLPQWPRVGPLGKSRTPRCLPATQQPAVPPVDGGVGTTCRSAGEHRLASMQRNVQFLQQQHRETLEKLHAEIEYLRRENKELQYKLIMEPPRSSRRGPTGSQRSIRPPAPGSDARAGLHLEEVLQDTRPPQDQALSPEEGRDLLGPARQDRGPDAKGGLITSLQPLRIHSSPSHPPRAPTLQECEVLIRQLYNANSLQSQEITRVKALLSDIVLSKKITPENYILTKAYLVEGTCKSSEAKKLPKLGLQTFPDNLPAPPQPGLVLPALKPSLSSTIAERQRRARAVQRERFKRAVH